MGSSEKWSVTNGIEWMVECDKWHRVKSEVWQMASSERWNVTNGIEWKVKCDKWHRVKGEVWQMSSSERRNVTNVIEWKVKCDKWHRVKGEVWQMASSERWSVTNDIEWMVVWPMASSERWSVTNDIEWMVECDKWHRVKGGVWQMPSSERWSVSNDIEWMVESGKCHRVKGEVSPKIIWDSFAQIKNHLECIIKTWIEMWIFQIDLTVLSLTFPRLSFCCGLRLSDINWCVGFVEPSLVVTGLEMSCLLNFGCQIMFQCLF